jgi:hypothetical protein
MFNQKSIMTKAALISLSFIFLLASAPALRAQSSATDMAVSEGVIRQANTILLRQKLAAASTESAHGDLTGAAKDYEDAYTLVTEIGSGIDAETAQTISGLTSTRLQLARQAQANGDLIEAQTQVNRVLKIAPQNQAALAFKKQNDQMMAAMHGKVPDQATLEQVPAINNDKTQAATLVQDGKLLYEMGKLEEADVKFKEALKIDPNNVGAFYYLNLTKQAMYAREERAHSIVSGDRIVDVEKAWEKPKPNTMLPSPNPYVSTNLIYTGVGRQLIMSKLDRIRMDSVLYDGLPLSEVIRNLSEQAKLRDPDKKGINFLINPNGDTSVTVASGPGGGPGGPGGFGGPGAAAVDPATGLPVAQASTTVGGGEPVDLNTVIIKINPGLTDVRLADVLDAIVKVADHPIKYSIEDYAIVFAARGAEQPTLLSRHFRVDPNTFEQGLQSVSAISFGEANSSGSSGGSGGSSGGGGGSSGGSGQNNNGAVVPVINVAPGSSGLRSQGQGGGGGGGGGGGNTGGPGGTGGTGANGNGGLNYITTDNYTVTISTQARLFFSTLGVNLNLPGKSIFFNDRLGELFVRATSDDLDTIENAIEVLNHVAPQIHIKARFIEILEENDTALGFDWYLGNYVNGKVVANGGSAPSLNVPVSSANPLGTFPGNTAANQIAGSSTDQNITSGLRNPLGAPALTTITGIMTDPNFRVVINALSQRSGTETLAEPEVVTTSGRQTQMRATLLQSIITSYSFQQGTAGTTTTTAQ